VRLATFSGRVSPTRSTANILRAGARPLLAQAVEIDIETFVAAILQLALRTLFEQPVDTPREVNGLSGFERRHRYEFV
jgi:hypothetical protein